MNKRTLIIIGIVVAVVLMIVGIFSTTNNRAISLEEQILAADSDIQVQEKRRTDLIYSDVDIDEVTTQISVVAEAYPELKSSDNYKELMNELAITENKIAEYRSTYNNQIRAYNKYVRKFPHKQILSLMGYETVKYKYLQYSEDDKKPVTNLFRD